MSQAQPTDAPAFTSLLDLASMRLGGAAIATNDEFFAEKENLIRPGPAVWKEHEYTDRGKWMDGWESRRKRIQPGDENPHDWAILRLGVPGVVRGVVVDTAFFRGNFPEFCSIEACALPRDARIAELTSPEAAWVTILPKARLEGNAKNYFAIDCPWAFSHVRLNIHPDGGVARLRVHGEVVPDFRRLGHARGEFDLAHVEHGGDVLLASDMFFGERRNLIMPGRAVNMSDGWETRRRRGPGSDWAIVKLGAPGTIGRVEIDTNHFIGNFPDTAALEAIFAPGATADELARPGAAWRPLLARTKLQAHTRHDFEPELEARGEVTHVRLSVYPDGGVSRLRVFGQLSEPARVALGVRRLDTLPPPDAARALKACNASVRWIDAMLAARPFGSEAAVFEAAERAWSAATPDDVREAMAAHPRIGERDAKVAREASERRWSAQEQAGMGAADDAHRAAMADANRAYEAKFGFTYIVCATGKSADELLATAQRRLTNSPEDELAEASSELLAITRLRLGKLLEP
jgi:allantoicase